MASRHPLPYAFAKANTLLLEDDGAQRVLWAADNSSASALSEVVRLFDVTSFEREAVRHAAPSASPRPTPAVNRARQRWWARSRARST